MADLVCRHRALLHGGRAALPRARRGRGGPDRAVPLVALPASGRVARAAHPAARRRLRAHRPQPVPPAGGHRPRRKRPGGGQLRALRPLRRLPVPHGRQGRRPRAVHPPGDQERQRHAAHARARGEARHRPKRRHGNGGRGRPPWCAGELQRGHRGGVLRRDQLVRAAAALGLRPAPEWARELVRRGGAQLHGAHQLGRDRDLADAEHDEVPEDARGERLLLGRGRLGATARAHPDAGEVGPAHPARGRTLVRAEAGARLHGEACDRLLADQRGPAEPDQPGDGRPLRPDPRVQAVLQPRGTQAAAPQAEGAARSARLPGEPDPEPLRARPADPTGRCRAPERHRPLRRRPRRARRST